MKKESIFFALILATSSYQTIHAQEELNFEEAIIMKRELYESMELEPEEVDRKMAKYVYKWRDHLTEDGYIGQLEPPMSEEEGEGERAVVVCSTDPASWALVGPHAYSSQWDGLMTEVYAPADLSYTLASSESGGIWKRSSGDPGWTNVTDALGIPPLDITAIVANPYDQDHIFASIGGYGIIESLNAGDTWSIVSGFTTAFCAAYPMHCGSGNDQFINVNNMIADPHSGSAGSVHLYITVDENPGRDVWKSTNSGATWTKMSVTLPTTPSNHHIWSDIEIDDAGNIFCTSAYAFGAHAGYYKYSPGSGWTNLTSSIKLPTNDLLRVKITKPDGSKIYAMRDQIGISTRQIVESTDRGQTWTLVASASGLVGPSPKAEIEYSPLEDRVFLGSVTMVKIDPATGSQTTINQGHVDLRDIYLHESGSTLTLFTANDGGISEIDYTTNAYTNLNGTSLPVLQFYDIGTANISSDRYIGGVAHNHAYRLNNGSWAKIGSGDGNSSIIHPTNPDIGYYTYGYGRPVGYNFATNSSYWLTGSGSPAGPWTQFYNNVEFHPTNPDTLYWSKGAGSPVTTSYLNLWSESSNTWTKYIVPHVKNMGEMAISKSSPNIVFVADGFSVIGSAHTGKLVKSTNYGKTGSWTSIGNANVYDASGATLLTTLNVALAWKRITDIEIDPYNSNKMWISVSGYQNVDEKYRVFMSLDGGTTWREHSQGLPRHPVNSLIQIESNGTLFAGTESGIYYRTASMTQWECFNEDMPSARIIDLDYNTCTSELVAATNGRGIWKTPVPGDLSPFEYTSNTTIYSGSSFDINTDMVVKAPAILKVEGTLRMAHGKKIVVEPGAKLLIDGGLITNQCDKLWGGVYIGGSIGLPQFDDSYILDPNQGTLEIINNGTIEHATNAVTTKSAPANGDHGGRIFATDGIFIDNRFGVEMLSYSGNNVSYFRNCTFKTDNPLGDPSYVDAHGRELGGATHVRLWDVDFVEFTGNKFENNGTFDQDLRGNGIVAIDAELIVDGLGGGEFTNLSTGVIYTSVSGAHLFRIYQNTFDNTVQNVTVTGGTNVDISNNIFANYQGSTSPAGIDFMQSWGVYLDATFGATVADNSFETSQFGTSNIDYFTRGVVAVNTGGYATDIEKNTFLAGNLIGFLGWMDNSDLQLKCNNFYSDYGIYVDRVSFGAVIPSKLPTQGGKFVPTGNKYFVSCADNVTHIYFDGVNPTMPNFPPIYEETHLEHFHYAGPSMVPTCVSNDIAYLAYSDPANPSPGWVTSQRAIGDFDFSYCEGGEEHEPGFGMSLEELTLEMEGMQSEIATANSMNEVDRINYLTTSNWLVENAYGEVIGGEKVDRFKAVKREIGRMEEEFRQDLIELYRQNLITETDYSSREKSLNFTTTDFSQSYHYDAENLETLVGHLNDTDYPNLFKLLYQLKLDERSYDRLNSDEMIILSRLAEQPNREGAKAASLLAFVTNTDYSPFTDPLTNVQLTRDNLTVDSDNIRIYPNPSDEQVNIVIELDGTNNQSLQIYNALGEQVWESQISNQIAVDVSKWDAGVYFVHLTINETAVMKKFTVY